MQPTSQVVIWNSKAGTAERIQVLQENLQSRSDVTVWESDSAQHTRQLACQAAMAGTDRIIAAGGDGTINSVINGLAACSRRPELGILPLGTGNDLCRTLNLPLDPAEAAEQLFAGNPDRLMIDLVRVESSAGETTDWFANVSNGGNGQRVAECLTEDVKRRWGAWCYLRGAVEVLTDLTGFQLSIRLDDGPVEQYGVWNVVVANGTTTAGGLRVAPRADVRDGLLDVILIQDGTPLDVAALSTEFLLSDYLEHERVVFRRARQIQLTSDPPMPFGADGESLPHTPLSFHVEHQALTVVGGARLGV